MKIGLQRSVTDLPVLYLTIGNIDYVEKNNRKALIVI